MVNNKEFCDFLNVPVVLRLWVVFLKAHGPDVREQNRQGDLTYLDRVNFRRNV